MITRKSHCFSPKWLQVPSWEANTVHSTLYMPVLWAFTSVEESGGSAHPPLALVHARSMRTAHLYTHIVTLQRILRCSSDTHLEVTSLSTTQGWSLGSVWSRRPFKSAYGTCVLYPPRLRQRSIWWNRLSFTPSFTNDMNGAELLGLSKS